MNFTDNCTTIDFGSNLDVSILLVANLFIMMFVALVVTLCYGAILTKAIFIAVQVKTI